jgi:peptide/nickel transport system permease protein
VGLFRYTIKKIFCTLPVFFGVTFISFLLMVYFGTDMTYFLLGRNPTVEDILKIRHHLGYDLPILERYFDYLKDLLSFDLGHSVLNHEKIIDIFRRSLPVSLALNLPGFLIGNALAIFLALHAALYRGRWIDKLIMFFSSVGMSMSFIIVIIGFQAFFCSSYGLNLFPVQGWDMSSVSSYLHHVCVPTMASIFMSLGYNTRFFRSMVIEELRQSYVRTSVSFGYAPWSIMLKVVLKNALVPVLTRLVFSIPFIFIEGSILLESFFGIPGMGAVICSAVASGDLPVLKAIVSLGALIYVLILVGADVIYKLVDPRISLR